MPPKSKYLPIPSELSYCIFIFSRNYMRGPQCMSKELVKKKRVIITGANSGIGLETAKELAGRGEL